MTALQPMSRDVSPSKLSSMSEIRTSPCCGRCVDTMSKGTGRMCVASLLRVFHGTYQRFLPQDQESTDLSSVTNKSCASWSNTANPRGLVCLPVWKGRSQRGAIWAGTLDILRGPLRPLGSRQKAPEANLSPCLDLCPLKSKLLL